MRVFVAALLTFIVGVHDQASAANRHGSYASWTVFSDGNDCWSVTKSQNVYNSVLLFTYFNKGRSVGQITLANLEKKFFRSPIKFKLTINNKSFTLPLVDDGFVWAASEKEDRKIIQELASGQSASLEAVGNSNFKKRTFSLVGYSKATSAANSLCGSKMQLNFSTKSDPVKTVQASNRSNNASIKKLADESVCYGATEVVNKTRVFRSATRYEASYNLRVKALREEVRRRGLDCRVDQNFDNLRGAILAGSLRTKSSYTQRCNLSFNQIKQAQIYLKDLGLYRYKIDGIFGKGTLDAIKKAKMLVGNKASAGECINTQDIYEFKKLKDQKSVTSSQNEKASTSSKNGMVSVTKLADENVCYGATEVIKNTRVFRSTNKYGASAATQNIINLRVKSLREEVRRRGLDCRVNQNFKNLAKALREGSLRSTPSYTQRCNLSKSKIKDAQKYLKELGLYKHPIDGIAGERFLKGAKEVKSLIGDKASEGECITIQDIVEFKKIALSRQCSEDNLEACTDGLICENATILSNGLRRWDLAKTKFIDQVKYRGLDCKITVDNTPLNQEEAKYFLSLLTDFVSKNLSDFDLEFASEFNKVRSITTGEWSAILSKDFELFRSYVSKFPMFQKYLEETRIAEEARQRKRIEQLRASAVQDLIILREWAQRNVLDEKAAQIAALNAEFGNKDLQTINSLEQFLSEAQRLLAATGINDGMVQTQTAETIDGLYTPSSFYLFANVNGDASSLYKNLDGKFAFEQGKGSFCPSTKLDEFDYYLLEGRVFTTFGGLNTLTSKCATSTDIFVVKGNELTSETVFDVIGLKGLQQVLEVSKAERDRAFEQLNFLKDTIKKDVMDGVRVGYGLVRRSNSQQSICAVIDGYEQGHKYQIQRSARLLEALGYPWSGFAKVTDSAEEAFKSLQREQCGVIYGSALTLGRLFLAGGAAGIDLEFMPIWVSKSTVEAAQEEYEAEKSENANVNAEAKQSVEDQAKLDLQAQQSKAELAAIRQLELRERNGLRFMVLRDELQSQVFSAVEFAFENPAEEAGYIKKYLSQSFVDQTTRYSPFDSIIADIQKLAAERWEITEQRIEQIDYGKAQFNGREVDALEVELRIASKNRLVGKYSEYCQRIHVIKDDDFDMWRNFEIADCQGAQITKQWKKDWAFESRWIVKAN